jgi:hypothetical protein
MVDKNVSEKLNEGMFVTGLLSTFKKNSLKNKYLFVEAREFEILCKESVVLNIMYVYDFRFPRNRQLK